MKTKLVKSDIPGGRWPQIRGSHWVVSCWRDHRDAHGKFHLDTREWFGFIYKITFLLTGERYLGKKAFHRVTKYGRVLGASPWRSYTSSSDNLNKLLRTYPKECFLFEIILLCKTKGGWSYAEANLLHRSDVLTERDGLGERRYLNGNISAIKWIPKEFDGPDFAYTVKTYIRRNLWE